MANYKGSSGPPEPFEDELLDEDLEQVTEDLRHLYHQEAVAIARSLSRAHARLQAHERMNPTLSPTADPSRLPLPAPATALPGSHTMKTTQASNTQAPLTLPRPTPFALSRLTGVAAILATSLLLTGALWGFLYFHAQRAVSPRPTLTATLACQSNRFTSLLPARWLVPPAFWQPPLDWSARGDISYSSPTQFFNAKTCASLSFAQAAEKSLAGGETAQVVWSPDSTRLLLLARPLSVLDAATGHILVSLQMSHNSWMRDIPRQAVWSDDGTQIIALTNYMTTPETADSVVQVWDSHTGALLRTELSLGSMWTYQSAWLSPNGAYIAVQMADNSIQFWNVATAQLVSTTAPLATGFGVAVAWSPDGSLFAFGISSSTPAVTPGQVQIWSRATGELVTTLTDSTTSCGYIDGLAWSPNGAYLAGTSGQINIWDTTSWQRVATFDKVDSCARDFPSQIITVTWSPDSTMLACVTSILAYWYASTRSPGATPTPPPHLPGSRLEVWQLSSDGASTPAASPTGPVASPTTLPATPSPQGTAPATTPVATTPSVAPTTPTPGGTAGNSSNASR